MASAGGRRKRSVAHNSHFTCSNAETEWTLTDSDGINYIISQLVLNGSCWSSMDNGIRKVQTVANKNPDMASVRPLLEKARQTRDVTYLLRAYTEESAFCYTLNKALAERVNTTNLGNPVRSLVNLLFFNENDQTVDTDWPLCFAGPIFDDIFSRNHPRYRFTGRTYRGIKITDHEFGKYVVGKLIFNKAFTSTSKQRSVAERFSTSNNDNRKKNAVFTFIFNDNQMNFTIDLHGLSYFPEEEEVLIMPGIPFRITKVTRANPFEIELQQYSMDHLLGKKKRN